MADDDDLYGFDSASVDALAEVTRQVLGSTEIRRRRGLQPGRVVVNNSPLEFCQVTSTTPTGNLYPASLYVYNATTDALDQIGAAGDFWLRLINSSSCPPVTGYYYAARRAGARPADNKTVFVTDDSGGGTTLTQVLVVDPATCATKTITIKCGRVTGLA